MSHGCFSVCSLSRACCVDASTCCPLDSASASQHATSSPLVCWRLSSHLHLVCRLVVASHIVACLHLASPFVAQPPLASILDPPSLFASAGCCIAPLRTASASRRAAASRLTTDRVVAVTEAHVLLPMIAIVALVRCHRHRCHFPLHPTLSPVTLSPSSLLPYSIVVVTHRPVAPPVVAIIIIVVTPRAFAIIVDFVTRLAIAIVLVVVVRCAIAIVIGVVVCCAIAIVIGAVVCCAIAIVVGAIVPRAIAIVVIVSGEMCASVI